MRNIFVINNQHQYSQTLANIISKKMDFITCQINIDTLSDINAQIDKNDAALLIIGINTNPEIQFYLNKCREIRIPYIFVKNNISTEYDISNILLPITNLEEEREKAPFASSFARHFNCPITIYQPNDYGSKAANNIDAAKTLFDSLKINHTTIKGKKDSSKIELEAGIANNQHNNLLIISASRDYGLDDIIFGPKEQKIIKQTNIPTMIINPRGDLYTLCD